MIDLATKYEIAQKSGAFYSYKDTKLGQGRENAKSYLDSNPKTLKELEKEVRDVVEKLHKEEARGINQPVAQSVAGPATAKPVSTTAPIKMTGKIATRASASKEV